jgi:FdhE protein
MPTPIITDGSMDRLIDPPKVVVPKGAMLFRERANRFDALANTCDNGLGDYLRLMGCLCRGQVKAYEARKPQPVSERALANSREHGMPPLSAHVFPREASWRDDLKDILLGVSQEKDGVTDQVRQVCSDLTQHIQNDPQAIESAADRLISGVSLPQDAPWIPFIGAALKVYFSRMAAGISAKDVEACDVATVCPCCGMPPTASIIRLDSDRMNYRYLVCSLCDTEWNMGRVKCSSCENEKGIGYLLIEQEGKSAADAAIRAETCDECKTYLKIMLQEKDPLLDILADDLNSLALDVMVDEKGYARTGPNLMFYPGHE